MKFFFFSDGTLNPNGIRFGSAEIYSVMDQFNSEILDSLCVAQRNPTTGHERVILFLKVSFTTNEKEKNDEDLFFYSNTLCLMNQ
jgi:acyl-coenzyme A synthetase/AMP-(fatty) acid ligase